MTDVTCLSCGSHRTQRVLDLGTTPLANAFPWPQDLDRPEPRFPLELWLCSACALVQLSERVDPEVVFREYVKTVKHWAHAH
jgi:hypothetical protein